MHRQSEPHAVTLVPSTTIATNGHAADAAALRAHRHLSWPILVDRTGIIDPGWARMTAQCAPTPAHDLSAQFEKTGVAQHD